jgi:PAS domain S-box-containing protein
VTHRHLDYLGLFDASPNPYLVLDRSLNIVSANKAYLASTKRTLDDIVGRWAWDAFPTDAETLRQSVESFERVIRTGQPDTMALLRFDVPRPASDGGGFEKRYWSITHTPVFNDTGDVELVLQHPIDVTELERLRDLAHAGKDETVLNLVPAHTGIFERAQTVSETNLALQVERDRRRRLLENMDQGYVFMDKAFRVQEINSYALRMEKRQASDILGKTHWEAWPGSERLPVADAYRRAMQGNVPVHLEHQYIFPDGRCIWIDPNVYPTGDGIAAFYRDISERKKTEWALRDSVERLEFTLDAARIGEWFLDLVDDTAHRSLRHDQCFGYHEPIADWGFAKFIQHVHPDDQAWVKNEFEAAVRDLQKWHFECRVVWPDHSVHWISAHGSVLEFAEGKPTKMTGIVYEITERKEAEEELRRQAKRRDEFLAMLAHELRNPLAPIGAAAELLQLVRHDEHRVRQTGEVIDRQVRHMTNLVDDLLDVSRVTRGLVELQCVPLDIRHVITDAVEQVSPLIHGRHHHLTLQLSPEVPHVMGDRKRLVQVIANLLNNAAKYTGEGGSILVRTEVREVHVLIEVADNGIGMPSELVGRVFDLFSQAERTSDRSTGGLGLGLALVKRLVELHGGSVSCNSPGVGKGSRFTVCLPRGLEPEHDPAKPTSHSALANKARSLRVLVVDDNADAAAMLAMLLEAAGHQVSVEHGSVRAVERARAEAPDVCLLDIGLPEMDGNELAKRLRRQPETASAVLVAVTGYGQETDREHSRVAGFDHHLVKPVDTAKLAAIFETINKSRQ